LESKAGWKGLLRKGVTLLIVLVSTQLDKMTGTEIMRDAVTVAYVVNEAISIIENAGLMGAGHATGYKKHINIWQLVV